MTNETDLRHQFTLASGVSFATALLLFGASWALDNKIVRLGMLGGSMASCGLAVYANNRREWLDAEDMDIRDILSNARKQDTLLKSHDFRLVGSEITNEEKETLEPEYKLINPENLKDNSVHIAIFASSGSGKTLFLRHLLNEHFTNDPYVLIDPHSDLGSGLIVESKEHALNLLEDFAYGRLNKLIIGCGRDWDSIFNFYSALEDHVSMLFERGGEKANWPQLSIICEELPAIIKNLDLIEKDLVASTNATLLAESRKVGVRLVILTQADQVKGLGLAGLSSLKSAYLFIRLGTDAIKHAHQKKLFNLEQKLKEDMALSFSKHKASGSTALFKGYCAMVNDDGYLPYLDLTKWKDYPMGSDLVSEAPTMASEAIEVEAVPCPESVPQEPTIATQQGRDKGNGYSRDYPSYRAIYGIGDCVNMPQVVSVPEKKVRVEVEDYWLSVYKNCAMYSDLENRKCSFVKDHHLSRYFSLRNKGETPSKSAKSMFSGQRYMDCRKWLEECYNVVIGSLEG